MMQPLPSELANPIHHLTSDQFKTDSELLEQQVICRTAQLHQALESLQLEILKRQQVEAALQQSESQFRLFLEHIADALFLIAPNGQIVDVNQRACHILGYTRRELLALSMPDIDTDLTLAQIILQQERLAQGVPVTLERVYRRKDKTVFPIEARSCLLDWKGQRLEVALVRDISDRQRSERAMQRLAEIGELAAMIVHEVRNPLTTILLGLNTFRKLKLPESIEVRLTLALEEGERLKRLLNEVLLFAKSQFVHSCELELHAVIREVLVIIHQPTQIELLSTLSAVWIQGDRDKLKQVFLNLLINACEATREGEAIHCQIHIDSEHHQVCIRIHNSGTPIPPHVLPHITQPFFTTKDNGTGLGLAIAKRIIEAHHGQLMIHSSMEGTTVSVQLPMTRWKA
jgi:PAS domain S-box-containing protein